MCRHILTLLLCLVLMALQCAAPAQQEPAMLDAVMEAIRSNDVEGLARLLDENPRVTAERDDAGMTPLTLAAYMNRPALVEIVRARLAEPDFFEACIIGDAAIVRAALASGQDVDAFAPDGYTPLGLAVFFRHPEVAGLLLDAHADPSLKARPPAPPVGPIHAAATREDLATLERLLLAGVDPDSPQEQMFRALHEAAGRGDLPMVALLLVFGADPSLRTQDGRSPADLARERGHDAVAERLDAWTP